MHKLSKKQTQEAHGDSLCHFQTGMLKQNRKESSRNSK